MGAEPLRPAESRRLPHQKIFYRRVGLDIVGSSRSISRNIKALIFVIVGIDTIFIFTVAVDFIENRTQAYVRAR